MIILIKKNQNPININNENNHLRKKRYQLLFVFILSGFISMLGWGLPYLSVRISQSNDVYLQLTGSQLYYTESLTLTFGMILAFTGSIMIFIYSRHKSLTNTEKKIENIMVVTIASIASSLLGVILVIIDIVNSFSRAIALSLPEPIILHIGFFLSVIGPIVLILGFIFLVNIRKEIEKVTKQQRLREAAQST